ncbi:LysR family transcriptional regulator [Antrihabitans spumae]|jgi:LysR family transcriptional regulator, transcriptional activator for bauABCD operon|uniref:LysR family transcriptional regulator n=1 Tax=Antrihabitans spumae TaxID=3373370 RepID=A0ABW7K9L2_9NOCA
MRNSLPDLKLLQIFDGVVRHQGFAPAQQELGLSASAISTYMSQLERQLGIVLCHRGRSGFSLTSKGELYHAECLRILGELEGFARYGTALQGELRGTLTIGVLDSTVTDSTLPLADVIGEFSREHPGVYLDLKIQAPHELQVGVLDDRIDVAIGAFASPMNGLLSHALHREQHWLYCSDMHPLFDNKRIPPDVITQQRMVTRGYWSEAELARQGFTQRSATVENMEAQLMLVLSGGYIGYLPEHYANYWVDRDRLRPLLPASFGYQAPFSLIYRRGRAREPLVLTFRELVRTSVEG